MDKPTVRDLTDFTLKQYTRLLQYLSQEYAIVPFREIPRNHVKHVILRHDVDFFPPAALKLAEIEKDMGIRATYFVLFSSRFYNVLEGNNVHILREISKLGHEIGLHYFPYQYRSYDRNMSETIRNEIQHLEHLIGNKVHSIARHGPFDRDAFAAIKGYINANHPNLRRDFFIHDSCRAWTPLEGLFNLLSDPPERGQLLIHPENWQDDKIDRVTLLERLTQNLLKEISALNQETKEAWFTDPFVINYDSWIESGTSLQTKMEKWKPDSSFRSKIRQESNYYTTLFRWYLVNTTFGWRLQPELLRIRHVLKGMFRIGQ